MDKTYHVNIDLFNYSFSIYEYFNFSNKKELDMKTKNQTKILKGKIEDELYLVSELASTIKENNSDILKNLENIESKLRIELDNFNNLD